MILFIIQIIIASIAWFALLGCILVLSFLIREWKWSKMNVLKTVSLIIFFILTWINLKYTPSFDTWGFMVYEGVCGVVVIAVAGYIAKRLPAYHTFKGKVAFYLTGQEVEKEPDVSPMEEEKSIICPQEEPIPDILTPEQKRRVEELLSTPDFLRDKKFANKIFAKEVGTNVSYLNQYFEQQYGMKYSEYVTFLRLKKAENILLETEIPIVDICDMIGLKSPASLFSLFKSQYGISPSEWKKREKMKSQQKR